VKRPEILTEAVGGGPLAQAGIAGSTARGWFAPVPSSIEEWNARVADVRASMRADWFASLASAFSATGAAAERLTSTARDGGVVVTTGQQPGLFGGPMYTWSKALTVRALADALQEATGVAVAPVFWAATDDSDLIEASSTIVSVRGGYERLTMTAHSEPAVSMSSVLLGDVSPQIAALAQACGSGTDGRALAAVRDAYRSDATVGGAYVRLLRTLLEPLGIAVLDASHPEVRAAGHAVYVDALRGASRVQAALAERSAAIVQAGFEPQVTLLDDLSLVFDNSTGRRNRISVKDAAARATAARAGTLSPNVLLRPVAERAMLPTVGYAAGPGEFAYFAQVSAVADSLGAFAPLAVPRWSVTIIEPHIQRLLDMYQLKQQDLADVDAVARRLSAARIPPAVAHAAAELRRVTAERSADLRAALRANDQLVPADSVDAIDKTMAWRVDRFERRLRAAVRRRDEALSADLGTLGGALYPGGDRQERRVSIIPMLVRHGLALFDDMLPHALAHARLLVQGARSRT
jgi:bacillithiol synthase